MVTVFVCFMENNLISVFWMLWHCEKLDYIFHSAFVDSCHGMLLLIINGVKKNIADLCLDLLNPLSYSMQLTVFP